MIRHDHAYLNEILIFCMGFLDKIKKNIIIESRAVDDDSVLKSEKKIALNNLEIDDQLTDRIFKFASIKHILNNQKNDEQKI